MNVKKLLAILMALTFVVCTFAACGGTKEETTTAPETEIATEVTTEEVTEAPTEEESTEAPTEEESTEAEKKMPETPEEILAAYTEVMNGVKELGTTGNAPSFTKVEWQELPDDANSRQVSKGSTVVNIALKAASSFVTTEQKAKSDPEQREKGNDMHSWPCCNTPKGCMVTDPGTIKSAKCEETKDGNYKITIVLNSENNPEPPAHDATTTPSNHGGMFGPLSKKDIDDTLTGNAIVTAVAKDITYTLRYHDCTAVLVYNPETKQVVSLDQTMHVSIKGSGKVAGISLVIDNQELVDYMHIYNVKY